MIATPAGLTWLQDHVSFSLGPNFTVAFTPNLYWFYIIVLLCLLTIFVVRRLDDSRLGRAWVAMREDEVAAASVGVDIMRSKLWAFSLGALWGGIAGATFANYQGFVSPESFTFMESVFVLCIVVLGGMGSIRGAILGACIIQGIPELIRGLASSGVVQLTGEQVSAVSNYRYLVFGLLMVIMMAVRPQGFIPAQRRAMELHPEDDKMRDDENQSLWDAEHKTETSDHDL
jgi:branched-chain amino acid transport system permease protein